MGTRAHTFVYEEEVPLVNIYCHWDGDPNNLGKKLGKILKNRKLVNGIPDVLFEPTSNGMGCLAAMLVAQLKTSIGDHYLYPIGTTALDKDFEYHIYEDCVVVKEFVSSNSVIFTGSWNEFVEFCNNWADEGNCYV